MKNIIFSSFRNKKKYSLYIFLLSIVLLIYLTVSILGNYYNWILNNKIGQKKINRELIVRTTDDIMNDEVKNILSIRKKYEDIIVKCNNQNLLLNEYNNESIKDGQSYLFDNDVIISDFTLKRLNLDKDNLDVLNVSVDNNNYTFNIKGISNSNLVNIYVSSKVINELKPELEGYIVLVNQYKNVDKVISYYESKGIEAELYNSEGTIEIEDYKKNINIYNIFKIIMIISSVILLIGIIINMLNNELTNISLLKILGYNNKSLFIIMFIRTIILIGISILIILFLLCLLNLFISIKMKNVIFDMLTINGLMLLISIIIIWYLNIRMNRKDLTNYFYE